MKDIGVLTDDISRSREIEDRNALQLKLKEVIETVNAEYGRHIISGFSITLGDEFQGAIKDPEFSYEIFTYFEHLIYPVRIKGGLGIGAITTQVSKNIAEMDGPVFHRSREALEEVKKSKKRLQINSENDVIDSTVNALLELIEVIKEKWTKRQREITWHVSREKTTIVQTAKHFDVTKQNISQILENASFRSVRKAEDIVKNIIDRRQSEWIDIEK